MTKPSEVPATARSLTPLASLTALALPLPMPLRFLVSGHSPAAGRDLNARQDAAGGARFRTARLPVRRARTGWLQ